tara:strand:+ start:959 stop:2254 length:1296 start_codon:yes stop_codon:yes gene_type:complete
MAALDSSIYEEIILTSADGKTDVDIASGTVMIGYYEDIFSPTITAKLQVVNDGGTIKSESGGMQSIYNGLPLRGGETVSIKIKGNSKSNPGLNFTGENVFFVSSISNVIVQKKTESFTLNLVSHKAIMNETSRVGRKYPTSNRISESVKDIIENQLGVEDDIDIDETQNVYGFIGNMRKPFTVLTWLASKSVPEIPDEGSEKPTNSTAGYVFYETKSGYHFRSIDSLIESVAYKPSYNYSEVIDKQADNDHKILRYHTSLNEDVLGKLQRGGYCSYRTFFNPLTFDYTDPSKGKFKLEDYKGKAKTMGKEVSLPGNLGDSPSRLITSILDVGTMEKGASKEENADPFLTQSQAMMRYNSIFSQKLHMQIPSNTNLESGNLIECEFIKSSTRDEIDLEQSGLYMIKELCHYFDSSGSYTSLTLIRDTFGVKE